MELNSNTTITESFVSHFKKIYIGSETSRFIIDNLDWKLIGSNHHNNLCAIFEEDEIRKAIFSFSNNEA